MILHECIKDLISSSGVEIVRKRQFVNILDDMGAFKQEAGASKRVLKGLLQSGFADVLCAITDTADDSWRNKVSKCTTQYAATSGYQEELIGRMADHLLYGAGVIAELPVREKPHPRNEHQPISDPRELMFSLKQEYSRALVDLMTMTTDEFGHKVGFYTSEAETALYILASKLRLTAMQTHENGIDEWIERERIAIEERHRPTKAQIRKALEATLASLQRQYDSLMEKSVTITDDEFGLKSAAFGGSSADDMLQTEGRILTIGQRLNHDMQQWIVTRKSDFLASKSSPVSARAGRLDTLKNEYRQRLWTLTRGGGKKVIDLSDTELRDLRRKLVNLGSLLGDDMGLWCDEEIKRVASARGAIAAKRRKRNLIIGVASAAALVIGGGFTISYTSSADARAHYEITMSTAGDEYSKGNYAAALALYEKAADEYDAAYSSTSYKAAAHDKAAAATDKIIASWQEEVTSLLSQDRVAKAKTLTLALPKNLVLRGESETQYKTLSAKIDAELERHIAVMIDELTTDIYVNQGHLSPQGRKKLDELAEVAPDNYWLNFIKNKSK